MYNESGFGTGGSPYEYVVTPKMTPALRLKKMLLIALYILWGGGLIIVGAAVRIIAPLLAFIPVTLWMLVFFTWKYTKIAYEYSFWGGELKVNRMLGERSRRTLVTVKIRDLKSVYPCKDSDRTEIKEFAPEREIFAASSNDAERLVAALWSDENNQKVALYFEADEKAYRILRYYNASIQ